MTRENFDLSKMTVGTKKKISTRVWEIVVVVVVVALTSVLKIEGGASFQYRGRAL